MMRLLYCLLLIGWACSARADETQDLRLIQGNADLPVIDLWLDLPVGSVIKPEQFAVSVGSRPAAVNAVEAFGQSGEGVAYIFLVDISKSLSAQQFAQIKLALRHWLSGMGDNDRAALLTFGREVKQRLAFTDDQDKLGDAVEALAPTDMETSLYRGLLEAISMGRRQEQDLPARRAIVVLSDGIDDSVSGASVDEVFKQSQEYRVPIYGIGFAAPPLNEGKRQGLKTLGMLSRQSGGYFVQAETGRLDAAYEQQQQQIVRAYRVRIDCSECVADGQLYRLNLTWNDGQRTLSDGLDMRLLPKSPASNGLVTEDKASAEKSPPEPFMLGAGLVLFSGLMLLLYRQRLAASAETAMDLPPIPGSEIAVETVAPSAPADKVFSVRLTVVTGMQKGKVYSVQLTKSAKLGRAPNCELTIDDDVEISGQHAILHWTDGKLQVRDLKSTNGTSVNGVPIHNDYPLRSGDLLLLGRTELRVELLGWS